MSSSAKRSSSNVSSPFGSERPRSASATASGWRGGGGVGGRGWVGERLGVGLACGLVAVSLQTLAQLQVVLDDAVVDQRDAAVAVGVGMCVVIGWASVGRPSGVADPRFPV